MTVKFAVIGDFHHLRDGISGEDYVSWIRDTFLSLEPVYGLTADARFASEVLSTSVLTVTIHNPKIEHFFSTISVINRHSLSVDAKFGCSVLIGGSVRQPVLFDAFFTYHPLLLYLLGP